MSSIENNNPNIIDRNHEEEEEEFLGAMLLSLSHVLTPALVASIDLNLFGIIAKECSGSSSAIEIACILGTKNPNAPSVLDQMLRLLATHSLLSTSCRTQEDGRSEILYGINPLSKMFIQNEDGVSLARFASLVKYQDDFVIERSSKMKDAIFEVDSEGPCLSVHAFEYLEKNKKFGIDFDKSMSEVSHFVVKSILKHSKAFDGSKTIVDVAGGNGTTLDMILSRYPSISGINFDLPRVIKNAPSYNTGIQHVGGDMFQDIPKGDTILLKWILHNWSDEKCLKILKNCYLALPESGKVIIMEAVLSNTPGTTSLDKYASLMDILMLCDLGGKERTEFEFKALAKGAGFSKFQIQYCGCGNSVMELFK